MGKTLTAALAGLFFAAVIYAKTPSAPQVLFVNLGKMNPTFNGGIYPDLMFASLPGITSQTQVGGVGKAMLSASGAATITVAGEPKVIVDYWNDNDAVSFGDNTRSNLKAIMVDKNMVGIWQGCINPDKPLESEGEGQEETLDDAFKYYIEKGKPAKEESGKTLDPTDNKGFLGVKMTDITVTDATGAEKTLSSIAAAGKPVLLILLQIPEDIDLNNPKEAARKARESKEFWKATAISIYQDITSRFFKAVEKDFFDKKIK